VAHIITFNSDLALIERALPPWFLHFAKGLRELDFDCVCDWLGIGSLRCLRDCHIDLTMIEKLSVICWRDDPEISFWHDPAELFDENAQITYTKTMSERKTTHTWSVSKGENLLRKKVMAPEISHGLESILSFD
jgi:hypothetical protein